MYVNGTSLPQYYKLNTLTDCMENAEKPNTVESQISQDFIVLNKP